MGREYLLDATYMEPPEPLVRALEMAEVLEAGDYLRLRHRREPCLLYDNLNQRGFAYITRAGIDVAFEVFIWREDDAVAYSLAQAEANKLST